MLRYCTQSTLRELTSGASVDASSRGSFSGTGRQFVVDIMCDAYKGAIFSELANMSLHPFDEWHMSPVAHEPKGSVESWHSAAADSRPPTDCLFDATRTVALRVVSI
jgi:hypothetical protein